MVYLNSCPIAQDEPEIKDEPTDVASELPDHHCNDAASDVSIDQNYITTNDDDDGYDEPDSPLPPQKEDSDQALPRHLALDSEAVIWIQRRS